MGEGKRRLSEEKVFKLVLRGFEGLFRYFWKVQGL